MGSNISLIRAAPWFAGTLLAATAPVAQADSVSVLQNGVYGVRKQTSVTEDFVLASSGTLSVTVQDFQFPGVLQNFSFSLYSNDGSGPQLLGSLTGPGTTQFQVGAGDVSAVYVAVANSVTGRGLYSVDLTFTPGGGGLVPLPPVGGALLLVGSMGLGWLARQRRSSLGPVLG